MDIKLPLLLLFICFFLTSGCDKKSESIPSLKPEKIKYAFRDSTYFSSAQNIQKYESSIFINDTESERVIELDSSLNLLSSYGRDGQGPGEFQYIGSIIANHDSLYIYDGGGMRFHAYSFEGEYIRSFRIPHRLTAARIQLIKDRLYLSSSVVDNDSSSIFVTNLKGNLIKYFEESSSSPKNYSTSRLLFSRADREEIIAVTKSEPFVERYSTNGEFLKTFDLRNISALEYLWDHYNEKQPQNTQRNKTILFTDAYMDDTALYINCAGWPGRDNYTYIIKLEVGDKGITPVTVFKIQGNPDEQALFQTILVDGTRLWTTNISTEAIYEFDISNVLNK